MMQILYDVFIRFITDTPLQLWASCFVIGFLLELWIKAERSQPWSGYLLNIRYGVLYLVVLFVAGPFVNFQIASFIQWAGMSNSIDVMRYLDFFYYWMHRAQHKFSLLWDQHAVHHSDEHLNVTTGSRMHLTEFLFQSIAIAVPMTLFFKITPATSAVLASVFSGWSFFIHMNLRLSLGPFSWLIAGPQVHRIHHSRQAEHFDKNFAAYFPIWDVLFRTYHHPQADEYPQTGIDGVRLNTVYEVALYPFKRWTLKAASTARSLSAAAKALVWRQHGGDSLG
jgi:sterol desaturase/sphingolipid hydroxylase (fatty acid hydroxylase superfamily)